jgi:hypothetical protein
MSVRYEGAGGDAGTGWRAPGEQLGEDKLPAGQYALVIEYDEVFYIQDTPERLRNFMIRLDEQLQSIENHQDRPLILEDFVADEENDFVCRKCDAFFSPREYISLPSMVRVIEKHIADDHPVDDAKA